MSFSTSRTGNLTVDLSTFNYGGIAPLYPTFESELKFDNSTKYDDQYISSQSDLDDEDTIDCKEHIATITPFHVSMQSFNHFRITSITIHQPFEPNTHNTVNDTLNTLNTANMSNMSTIGTLSHTDSENEEFTMDDIEITFENDCETEDPKRKFIEKEIIETEETYYRGLNTVLNELLLQMFDNSLIPLKYFEQCTSNLPDLLAFHDKLLTDLVSAYESTDTTIAQVFTAQNKETFISLYSTYIRDYESIMDLFGNTFRKNEKLQIFLKLKRRERKPLTNFLILPIQRVPRYILLLTDLKKHTLETDIDYQNIGTALDLMQEIANEINERKRKIENMSQCLQIQSCLSNLSESIVREGREYQRQFVFIKKSHSHQRQFFVFTDIIIVTNQQWRVKHILEIGSVEINLCKKKKIGLVKKRISFRFGKNKELFEAGKNSKNDKENNAQKFIEFTLLAHSNDSKEESNNFVYIAQDMHEFVTFESLVKQNKVTPTLPLKDNKSEIRQTLKDRITKRVSLQHEKPVLTTSKTAPI